MFEAVLKKPGEETLAIEFGVLCASCEKTITNTFDSINKTDKKSPERGAKKEDSEESPEVTMTSGVAQQL